MNQVFLLGAGFTRAVTEEVIGKKALLADEIMPKLDLSGFPEIIEDYEKTLPDIEQFITQLDLRCLRFDKNNVSLSKRLNEIRDNIVEQIVNFFDVSALSVDNLDRFPLLKKFVEKIPEHSTILTLNYDCVLDQGLWLNKRWHYCGGYFIPIFFCSKDENKEKDDILLLKLHGSCNFRKSFLSGYEHLVDSEFPTIEINDKIFPGCHSSHGAVGDVGPHVLVMTYLKIYHKGYMKLWVKALEALKDADKLTIIGCSLREEDTFLRFALYHFGLNKDTPGSIDIVDISKESCQQVEGKIKKFVAHSDPEKIKLYYDEKGNIRANTTGLKRYVETCQN
jgi:hypothetical protein